MNIITDIIHQKFNINNCDIFFYECLHNLYYNLIFVDKLLYFCIVTLIKVHNVTHQSIRVIACQN